MERKLKLGEVINIYTIIKSIIDGEEKVDTLFKFKLLGIMKELETHVVNYDYIKNEKIREYGKSDEEGKIYIPEEDKESVTKFMTDIKSLLDSDITIFFEELDPEEVINNVNGSDKLLILYSIMKK